MAVRYHKELPFDNKRIFGVVREQLQLTILRKIKFPQMTVEKKLLALCLFTVNDRLSEDY